MRTVLTLLVLVLTASLAVLWLLLGDGSWAAAGPPPVAPRGGAEVVPESGVRPAEAAGGGPARTAVVPEATLEDAPAAGPPGGADDPPAVIGRVVDEGGHPVEGARVLASTGWSWMRTPLDMEDDGIVGRGSGVASAETDAEGRFALGEPLEPGRLRLALRAHGRAPLYLDDLRLGEPPPHDLGELVMEPGITLSGRVVERGAGGVAGGVAGARLLQAVERGVGGHLVGVPGRGVPLGETGAEGRFRVTGLAPGPWTLLVDSPEHRVSEVCGRRDSPGEVEDVLIVLERGDSITGRVAGLDAARLADLRVDARVTDGERRRDDVDPHPRARRARVTAGGAFRVAGLTPGVAHRLTLWEPDEEGRHQRVAEVPPVEAWPGSREVVLEAEARASITVRVVDEAGEPVERFVLHAGVGGNGRVRTRTLKGPDDELLSEHPGGVAVFEGLRPPEAGGEATVRVVAPGHLVLEREGIPLARGEELDLGPLVLEPGPLLRVTVRSAAEGAPIERARVLLGPEDRERLLLWAAREPRVDPSRDPRLRTASTDPQGMALVSRPEAEPCLVVAAAEGFVPCPPARARAGAASLDLELAAGGVIDVRVVDAAGEPVVGAEVRHRPADDADVAFRRNGSVEATGAGGRLRLGPLEPRTWILGLHEDADRAEPVEVRVLEGGAHEVTLTRPPRADLEGTVTRAGVPFAGAELALVPLHGGQRNRGRPGGESPRALSGHDGVYRLLDVPCDAYRLVVTHPERYMPEWVEVNLGPGGARQDVELTPTVIEGTVRYPDGRPVAHVDVEVAAADGRRGARGGVGQLLVEDDRGRLRPDWSGRIRHVETDSHGRYRVAGLAAGVELTITTSGPYSTQGRLAGLVLAPGELRSGVDLEVRPAGRLSFRAGDAVAGGAWRVLLSRERSTPRSTQLWGRGERVFGALVPGEWTLELFTMGAGGDEPAHARVVEVVAEETVDLVLEW